MTVQTFGRRGSTSQSGATLTSTRQVQLPSGSRSDPLVPVRASTAIDMPSAFDGIPFLTLLLAVGFFAGYALQHHLAFHIGPDGTFDLKSLIATGAVSYDLVFLKGEWWRIFLAPLLHGGISHQLGNTFALCLAGFRLEPMVGRFWFLTIFCLAALGGVGGSLVGNPHAVVTVGASGGISGLLGALFVASFHHKADELSDRKAMRRTALRFGLPALLPIVFNVHNGVDYFAHAAGAATGALLACLICLFWPGDARRPRGSFMILLVPAAYFSLAIIGAGYAARDFQAHRLDRPDSSHVDLMADSDLPKKFLMSETDSAALVSRFPNDPRAHLFHGTSLLSATRYGAAEYEFRAALDRFKPGDGLPGRELTLALLAFDLSAQGRKLDARDVAAPLCSATSRPPDIETLLARSNVCEPVKP